MQLNQKMKKSLTHQSLLSTQKTDRKIRQGYYSHLELLAFMSLAILILRAIKSSDTIFSYLGNFQKDFLEKHSIILKFVIILLCHYLNPDSHWMVIMADMRGFFL